MRVLHFVGSLDIGGEQRYVAEVAARLDPARVVQTVAYGWGDALRGHFDPAVPLVEVTGRRPRFFHLADWAMVGRFARLIRARGIEVVATHSPGIGQIAASMAARACGVPVVHTIQRSYANRSRTEDAVTRNPVLRRAVYALTDRWVALGSYYAREHAERWKIPPERTTLNYIGVDLRALGPDPAARAAVRAEMGWGEETPVLGVVARLSPEKRVDRGIDAFARVHARLPGARLLLVGDGPARGDLQAMAAGRGLSGAVAFAGARTDVPRWMNGMDALVQTSPNPLNGIVSIEAMAVGKPVVTLADRPDEEEMAADTCAEGVNGLFYRTADPEGSADRLAALLADPARRAAMGRASRALAVERFDLDRHVAALGGLYESLAAGRRAAAPRRAARAAEG